MSNTPSSRQHSPRELQAALATAEPPLLLDVREYPESATGHLKGAQLLPLAELDRRASELPKERAIVCVCQSGRRSDEAAIKLKRLGFSNISQLAGGMTAWEQAGLPVERHTGAPWALERQVRLVAGLLVMAGLGLALLWPVARALSWFVGAGLVFAAVTDWCGMGLLLAKMPWNRPSGNLGGTCKP